MEYNNDRFTSQDPIDDIPPKFYDRLKKRILTQVLENEGNNDCWKWLGPTNKKDGYGHVVLSVAGDRMSVNAQLHILLFIGCLSFHLTFHIYATITSV